MKAALKVVEAAERIRVKNDTKYGTSRAMRPGGTHSPNTEPPTATHEFRENPLVTSEDLNKAIEPIGKEIIFDGLWKNAESETERVVEDFAGDDTPHVEKLLEPLGDTPRTIVHVKSPELATETLVVLSPEGETLLKIVKDNSRKFEVK